MRVDKYLWCIRLFKTRSIATRSIQQERVEMEHQLIKPSRTVSPGDKITIKYRGYQRVFEVLDLPKSRLGARLVAEYVREITPQAELEKRDLIQKAQVLQRPRGLGRPTKRDRRDLDAWSDFE
jgi:ribosome-associated heat shock protein Hsp15